jgi:hypothetical protein
MNGSSSATGIEFVALSVSWSAATAVSLRTGETDPDEGVDALDELAEGEERKEDGEEDELLLAVVAAVGSIAVIAVSGSIGSAEVATFASCGSLLSVAGMKIEDCCSHDSAIGVEDSTAVGLISSLTETFSI